MSRSKKPKTVKVVCDEASWDRGVELGERCLSHRHLFSALAARTEMVKRQLDKHSASMAILDFGELVKDMMIIMGALTTVRDMKAQEKLENGPKCTAWEGPGGRPCPIHTDQSCMPLDQERISAIIGSDRVEVSAPEVTQEKVDETV